MKILSLIAGAGDMYCGSCLRDNALAGELRKQGHDVILTPLYTPVRVDDVSFSGPRVFFGGISIYLQQMSALFRALPKFFDKLWDAPSVIKAFTGRGVEVDPKRLGELTVSMLRGEDGNQRKEIEHLAEWLRHEPKPDLVTIPYTLLIALAAPLRKVANAPIVCGLQGEELFLDNLGEPYRTQALDLIRRHVPQVDAFIAVSEYGKRHMSAYLDILPGRIHVVPLGVDVTGCRPKTTRAPGPTRIGYFSRIAPEKGLHLLADAYIQLRKSGRLPAARLEAAGYLPPEKKSYLAGQEDKLRQAGLAGEFQYHGAPDRAGKLAFLQSLDVLVMPTDFDEPKGIPFLEALSNGVPVIAPNRGAFPEMAAATGGGILYEKDALSEAILSLVNDPDRAQALSRTGYENVHRHWTLELMAQRTMDVFNRVTAASSPSVPSSATSSGAHLP